jgi:hypothetical protein
MAAVLYFSLHNTALARRVKLDVSNGKWGSACMLLFFPKVNISIAASRMFLRPQFFR